MSHPVAARERRLAGRHRLTSGSILVALAGWRRHRVDADQVFSLHPEHDDRDDQGEQRDAADTTKPRENP